MIDLHAHLLPGVDDGPTSWEEAIAMVRVAAEEGVTAMVATSHMIWDGLYANSREQLLELVGELSTRVLNAGIPVTIYPGAEIYVTHDIVDRLERGELLTYCDAGHYVLLEMPASEIPPYVLQVVDDLRLRGVTPIIAHPERNMDIIRKPSRATALVERGALLQITASSLAAAPPVRDTAGFLLQQGLVHFLATDTHGIRRRTPRWKVYLQRAHEWMDTVSLERIVLHNPLRVLRGERIDRVDTTAKIAQPTGILRSVVRRFLAR